MAGIARKMRNNRPGLCGRIDRWKNVEMIIKGLKIVTEGSRKICKPNKIWVDVIRNDMR